MAEDKIKDIVAFTACDFKNLPYARLLIKSFQYFHPDIPFVLFSTHDPKIKGVRWVDISIEATNKDTWYMQKPLFAQRLFKEGYKGVLGLDSDQLILGSLDYLFNHEDYDIGTVLNFNPLDFRTYGKITFEPIHFATEYYNCGLVMMRNPKLVDHWLELCRGKFFSRFPYKEQDLLNIIAYFGEYKVKCFDDADPLENYYSWHGLLATHQGLNMKVVDGDIILPKSEDGYPSQDIKVKVYHWAGGQSEPKMNYRLDFNEEIITRIDQILGIKK